MKILTAFGKVHPRDEIDCGLVSYDIRGHHVLPHTELDEDVRRHMQGMRRCGRDSSVHARGRERENCMIRIVEGVDDEVSSTRMVRILLKYFEGDRSRERLTPEALIGRPDRAEQRKRVKNRDLVIVRPAVVEARHRI